MTNKAFGEKWYEFGLPMKRTFLILIMGNNLECKLSACDKFNLSLPAFMAVRIHALSICFYATILNFTSVFLNFLSFRY